MTQLSPLAKTANLVGLMTAVVMLAFGVFAYASPWFWVSTMNDGTQSLDASFGILYYSTKGFGSRDDTMLQGTNKLCPNGATAQSECENMMVGAWLCFGFVTLGLLFNVWAILAYSILHHGQLVSSGGTTAYYMLGWLFYYALGHDYFDKISKSEYFDFGLGSAFGLLLAAWILGIVCVVCAILRDEEEHPSDDAGSSGRRPDLIASTIAMFTGGSSDAVPEKEPQVADEQTAAEAPPADVEQPATDGVVDTQM